MSKYLIAGLGNIGEEYHHTRHNIGFDVVDFLANKLNVSFSSDRLAYIAEAKYKGRQLYIIKPTTYMNLSGKAVAYWKNTLKIPNENLLIIVDEMAFPVGQFKIHPKGSNGGHNGLKSIEEHLQTSEYPRLRVGIGNNFPKGKQVEYVLGKWSTDEWKIIEQTIPLCADAVLCFAFEGIQNAMNKYNTKKAK
ncbi:MAG TPA: aminoacyl-tRNA hydrolase [Bacteroidia bacterium]|mgnify:CR=1 FL=1|nr:aminoacyl-tRNA hydrolase [Bacteroidia bacterium]